MKLLKLWLAGEAKDRTVDWQLPQRIPGDGCAFCCVFYGGREDYLLMLLVLARRLAAMATMHPLLVLPTLDVPEHFLVAMRRVGCLVQEAVPFVHMHPALLRDPKGRHCLVATKLQVLRLTALTKVLLLDVDVLPRRRIDWLFELDPPAALLMPANLPDDTPKLPARSRIPHQLFDVDHFGRGARVNAGVCLLRPDLALLQCICTQISPKRTLEVAADVIQDVFGSPWRPSWTPEEDALTRGLRYLYPWVQFTHIGFAANFEVTRADDRWPGTPFTEEYGQLHVTRDVELLHFTGAAKPTWYTWHTGHMQATLESLWAQHRGGSAVATGTLLWIDAFEELRTASWQRTESAQRRLYWQRGASGADAGA